MQALRRTWFISDLHLDPQQRAITEQFKQLLAQCDSMVDHLYILGDLFELWIGDDDDTPFLADIILSLRRATQQGTRIHIMHGNRDFLLGKKFLQATGCDLLLDETVVDVYGKPVLLMHGDTLCTADVKYLQARKWARNRLLQQLFLSLPLSWRRSLAAKARHASHEHTSNTPLAMMDVTQAEVERVMQHYQTSYLIHGHTHRPDIHSFTRENIICTRIVLPAWHNGGSVFEWREDGTSSLMPIPTK